MILEPLMSAKPDISIPLSMRQGRCYELAYRAATEPRGATSPRWCLVHGAHFKDDLWIAHCWVQTVAEDAVVVFDVEMDVFAFETSYLERFAARKIAVYSPEMAKKLSTRETPYGPWFPYWFFSLGAIHMPTFARDVDAQHTALLHYFETLDRGAFVDLAGKVL